MLIDIEHSFILYVIKYGIVCCGMNENRWVLFNKGICQFPKILYIISKLIFSHTPKLVSSYTLQVSNSVILKVQACVSTKFSQYVWYYCTFKQFFLQGFYLEGAQWNREQMSLAEMPKKKLHDQLPIILFQPAVLPEDVDNYGKLNTTVMRVSGLIFLNILKWKIECYWVDVGWGPFSEPHPTSTGLSL